MSRLAVAITLSEAERRELEGLARRRKTAQGLARRARIVLAAADGLENKAIVALVGTDASTVGKWRRRFADDSGHAPLVPWRTSASRSQG